MKSAKEEIKVGNWNVRTLYAEGKTSERVYELERYDLDTMENLRLRKDSFRKWKSWNRVHCTQEK